MSVNITNIRACPVEQSVRCAIGEQPRRRPIVYSFTTSICLSITCPVNRSIATCTQYFLPSRMMSPQTLGSIYPQLVEIQLRFHMLPWHARFAGIAFNCAAQLDEVFHVFDTLLKPTHFGSERLQGWFLQ